MNHDYTRIARNATLTMLVVQALSSFGNSMMATVNTIVGADLSGSDALAGLPNALVSVGGALAALMLGITMDRWGRRYSLSTGMAIGFVGAVIAAIAVVNGSFPWFLFGLMFIGFTRASSMMGRFVAAEVSRPEMRGRAISYVVLGGTFGSVIGPLLVQPSGDVAASLGVNLLMGPYGAAIAVLLLAALMILLLLRPEPREIGREIARLYPEEQVHSGPPRSLGQILRLPTATVAFAAMLFGQVVMVSLMGITSLHMHANEHPLTMISAVFSAHTFGMFAPSIITGQLLDRWGRGPVILTGAGLLFAACGLAPIWLEVVPIGIALFLLGLGWNFCYIGGSTLLSDILTPGERARTQGANDLTIALATAVASFTSGIVFDSGGYLMAGMIGAAASLIPFLLTGWWMVRSQTPAAA